MNIMASAVHMMANVVHPREAPYVHDGKFSPPLMLLMMAPDVHFGRHSILEF